MLNLWKFDTVAFILLISFSRAHADVRNIEGWTVHINEKLFTADKAGTDNAIELLTKHLKAIERDVPGGAVRRLKEVHIWLNPQYPGVRGTAEYHPGAGWLRENGRNPEMVKGVEITDVDKFEQETNRMPVFVLHEMAHSFHDRVLGFEHPEIMAAYQHAKESKKYDKVERWLGNGKPNTFERAYAMTNEREYFAESTEAFFGRNDFYPFDRKQLHEADPEIEQILEQVWTSQEPVTAPPAELKIPSFYTKYISARGYPIVASSHTSDYALKEAAYLINSMLMLRPDVREAMIKSGSRMCLLAHDEFTSDLPEFKWLMPHDFWDARARGTGGSETDPYCSAAEENLINYPGDPYPTECIMVHEFAHNIHLRGMVRIDPTFDKRLKETYDAAMKAGLWKGKYAATNHHEYFAEGVQSWFDNNRPPDFDHNYVHTREQLKEYDPGLAKMCEEVFRDSVWKYTYPNTRLRDHLAGYEMSKSPSFVWPARLDKVRKEVHETAVKRDQDSKKPPK